MAEFSHLDEKGQVKMVSVSSKEVVNRIATARSIVYLPPEVMENFTCDDIQTKKGSVFQTSILAGILAAKKTGDLIPLCHPLPLDDCRIAIHFTDNELMIDCTVTATAKTGVEMEALVGASIAALTVYDMCKAFSHDIVIRETKLMEKKGGKRDFTRS